VFEHFSSGSRSLQGEIFQRVIPVGRSIRIYALESRYHLVVSYRKSVDVLLFHLAVI